MKLRNLKIILIRMMIVIIITLITVVIIIIIIIKKMIKRHVNNTTNTVFTLGDSIVKNVNGYLLTKKLRIKKLIKVRSFSGAKVNCMYDHVKTNHSRI